MVLFSHSSGWMPQNTLANLQINSKSILVDNGSEMELTDFARSIPSQKFDFIIFESHFMGGIEVVYEFTG